MSNEILLLAQMVDRLSLLIWQNTRDGEKGRNKPPSLVERLLYGDSTKQHKTDGFDSPEAFWNARAKIIGKGAQHG